MAFMRNCWYVASWTHSLTASCPLAVTIIDEPLVLFRTREGSAAALRDCCCHRNAPLSHGRCENGVLRCMYHGLMFDGSGQCVGIPGQTHIPSTCRVRSYPVLESRGCVFVWMGDPARADPLLIPLPDDYDPRDWDLRWTQCDLRTHYMLMNDNLADMSHVAFLHEATFGGGDTRIAETHPTITRLERGLRVERWLSDRDRVEHWLPDESNPAPDRRQDMWLAYDLIAPGIFVMRTEIHRAGVARESGYTAPTLPPLHSNLNVQAVTPVSETSMRHFFALGPPRLETQDNPALADAMFQLMCKGFEEDRIMLEAQQRNINRWPVQAANAIRHDRGVHLLRRIIDNLVKQDSESAPAPGVSSAGASTASSASLPIS
jgi:phenylpropionate dioxygenase-like ring-hydroxylating dioxygenase large terminal subunit